VSTQNKAQAKSWQPEAERVALLVGGKAQDQWQSYEVDSDLLTPADAWRVRLGLPLDDAGAASIPSELVPGAEAQLRIGGELVMTGRIDDMRLRVDKRAHSLEITGRDGAAALLDCSAPLVGGRKLTLEEILVKVVRPLGVTKVRLAMAKGVARQREKVTVEPGDTAWDTLAHVAEANGVWPWMDPDGTLVIGGPDYTDATNPAVATLCLAARKAGEAGVTNVAGMELRRSVAERYSIVTVLGQTHGTEETEGKRGLKSSAVDPDLEAVWSRRKIITDYEADSVAVCRSRAQKLLADSRLRGFELRVEVQGHRINAPAMPGHGKLWTPGQRVQVIAPAVGLMGTYFLMARTFTLSPAEGTVTRLSLREDKVWILEAHPHRRKHRKGKHYAPEVGSEVSE
jgi:prophage tail gpP-like protein